MSKILARIRRSRLMKCVRPQEDDSDSKSKAFSDDVLESPPPPPPSGKNNQSGLGVRQVFSLRQSWKGVMRVEEDFFYDWFMRLFKTNGKLQTLFGDFKDVSSEDELRQNEALEHHATLVMTTLDDAITHIDDYDFVRTLLLKTGGFHVKFKGFEPEYFGELKQPFLAAVRETLGDRYTENIENIYTIAIAFILENLQEGINAGRQRQKEQEAKDAAEGKSVDGENGTAPSTVSH